MVDESAHNNPRYPQEERFQRLEEKIVDMCRNMPLLMVYLARNLRPFREVGGLNSKIGLDEKPWDNKDLENESQKEPEKEQASSITINASQYLFKMEEKVDIKPYQGEIVALKLNHWLQ
jgi:hypothetical protein